MNLDKRLSLILELGFRPEAVSSLQKYLDLLWTSNEELNLISRKMTQDELIDNHVVDCLLPLKSFPKGIKQVADFGSGGGLPGVIYAIQFPEITFHLYEKSNKKQAFLQACKSIAPNLQVHGEIPPKLPAIDLVISRAFKPIDVILEFSRNYYQNKGRYFLLKGRAEKIEEEMVLSRKKFKDVQAKVEPLKSPIMDVERHLVLIGLS